MDKNNIVSKLRSGGELSLRRRTVIAVVAGNLVFSEMRNGFNGCRRRGVTPRTGNLGRPLCTGMYHKKFIELLCSGWVLRN